MVQCFTDLHYTADLQSSTVLSKAKAKLPHNFLIKRTEYTVECALEVPTLLRFQQWLEFPTAVVEKLQLFLPKDSSHQADSTERDFHRPKPSTSTPEKTTGLFPLQAVALHCCLPALPRSIYLRQT